MIPKNIPVNGNDSDKPKHLKLVPKNVNPDDNKCVNEDRYIDGVLKSLVDNTTSNSEVQETCEQDNQDNDQTQEVIKYECQPEIKFADQDPKKTFLWRCLMLSIKTSKYASILAIITLVAFFGSLFFLFIQNVSKGFH